MSLGGVVLNGTEWLAERVEGWEPQPNADRPLVTRRAPRSLTLGEVPTDEEPKFINQDERGVGDCTACGATVRMSGQVQHRWWHQRYLGDVEA